MLAREREGEGRGREREQNYELHSVLVVPSLTNVNEDTICTVSSY